MALLQTMQQPQQMAQQPQQPGQPQGGRGDVQTVVSGMLAKLFPDSQIQQLIGLLKQQGGRGMQQVVAAIVQAVIALLQQGKEQGKSLPAKIIMGALMPIAMKIAEGVEDDEARGAALLAELISSVGQQLAVQGGQQGVIDQQQAQQLHQMVQAFVAEVSPHFQQGGQPQQMQQQPGGEA